MEIEIDKSNMRQVIIDSPQQLLAGLDLAKNIAMTGNFENMVICGIGGSALPANLLIDLGILDIPLYIHRDYGLPKQATEKSLVICISYSGNTEETVSAMELALEKKLTVVAMATGGKVEELAIANRIPLVKLPSGIQPRSATGYIFSALVTVLENAGIITGLSQEIESVTEKLPQLNAEFEERGKILAKSLVGKIPVVYASEKYASLARIWKIKFNENSKIPAYYNCFPELNHNEMVGYEGIKNAGAQNLHIVTLRDINNHPRILKRMDLTASIIEKSGAAHTFVEIKEGSMMEKLFSTLLLGDWTSYYLALEYGIDPAPVKTVEEFKASMKK